MQFRTAAGSDHVGITNVATYCWSFQYLRYKDCAFGWYNNSIPCLSLNAFITTNRQYRSYSVVLNLKTIENSRKFPRSQQAGNLCMGSLNIPSQHGRRQGQFPTLKRAQRHLVSQAQHS